MENIYNCHTVLNLATISLLLLHIWPTNIKLLIISKVFGLYTDELGGGPKVLSVFPKIYNFFYIDF